MQSQLLFGTQTKSALVIWHRIYQKGFTIFTSCSGLFNSKGKDLNIITLRDNYLETTNLLAVEITAWNHINYIACTIMV